MAPWEAGLAVGTRQRPLGALCGVRPAAAAFPCGPRLTEVSHDLPIRLRPAVVRSASSVGRRNASPPWGESGRRRLFWPCRRVRGLAGRFSGRLPWRWAAPLDSPDQRDEPGCFAGVAGWGDATADVLCLFLPS
jgi:hypothetical protein